VAQKWRACMLWVQDTNYMRTWSQQRQHTSHAGWAKKISQRISVRTSSTLCQIWQFFWHTGGQDDKIVWGALIFRFTYFMSSHYHVKHRCSKLLHYAVIISIRLLICTSPIRQTALWFNDFVVLNVLCWK